MPTLFEIGPIAIRGYGLMWVIGILLAMFRASRVAKKYSFTAENILDLAMITVGAGIIGARLLDVALNWQDYSGDLLRIVKIWEGGLSFFGGFLGGALGGIWYARKHNIPFWNGADIYAPSLALGYAVARLGCLFAGCCYGQPTDLPWGLCFPDEHHPGALTPPSHPTQIYSFLFGLVIFGVLVYVEKRRRFTGQVFASFLILFGMYRFAIEFLRRGVTSKIWFDGFTYGHAVAVVVILLGIIFYVWRSQFADAVETAPSGSGKPHTQDRPPTRNAPPREPSD